MLHAWERARRPGHIDCTLHFIRRRMHSRALLLQWMRGLCQAAPDDWSWVTLREYLRSNMSAPAPVSEKILEPPVQLSQGMQAWPTLDRIRHAETAPQGTTAAACNGSI